jgi:zinc transport system substrate-binding protein
MKKFLAIFATLSMALAACSASETAVESQPEDSEVTQTETRINVSASFYPLAFIAEQILGDLGEVTLIATGSTDPHDLELTPSQVANIVSSDFAVYIPEFMPAFDAALKDLSDNQTIDITRGITLLEGTHGHEDEDEDHGNGDDHGHENDNEFKDDHDENDPHIWLNPLNMITMGATIADQISLAYPDFAAEILENLAAFNNKMTDLDSSYQAALVNCDVKTLLVSHEAFGYLANRYRFEQLGLSGISPEAEPSPARLAEVAKVAQEINATTIYYETAVDPKVALTLANEIGLATAVLDPLETKPEQGDYLYAMEQNLEVLTLGQGCKP